MCYNHAVSCGKTGAPPFGGAAMTVRILVAALYAVHAGLAPGGALELP